MRCQGVATGRIWSGGLNGGVNQSFLWVDVSIVGLIRLFRNVRDAGALCNRSLTPRWDCCLICGGRDSGPSMHHSCAQLANPGEEIRCRTRGDQVPDTDL
jgi:hypothetical protein